MELKLTDWTDGTVHVMSETEIRDFLKSEVMIEDAETMDIEKLTESLSWLNYRLERTDI